MATLMFSALGTALGGPLGGMVGALLGQQVDSAIWGNGKAQGPRLKELEVTTSSYGSILARHYGRMRVPGTIIWATDLKEASETQGGKNRPDVTTYSYSVSFAVALASRPIKGMGRIWADGRLLRGEAGDLKVSGTMRLYTGQADQPADPIIIANEGASHCPAYRGLAYVVFEDLDLSTFYNRLPALTFEVIADEGAFSLADIVGEVLSDTDAAVPLSELTGYSCEGPLAQTLSQLQPLFPVDTDANGPHIVFSRERIQSAVIALPEAAIATDDDSFGGVSGFARQRRPAPDRAPEILRYYDVDRDYLPGLQRAISQSSTGQAQSVEISASITATNARALVEKLKQNAHWSRNHISWRCTQIDPALVPGAIVTVPEHSGHWRINEWEWRQGGVELSLQRVVPIGADALPASATTPGRITPALDLPAPPTALIAYELPWSGNGDPNTPHIYAAVSSNAAHWSGAALFVDDGNGALESLGPSGRTRCVLGKAVNILPSSNPLLIDRSNTVDVQLVADDLSLSNVTQSQLSAGWNRALLGNEIIQFSKSVELGNRIWRLSGLIRGLGGTEDTVGAHQPSEHFVLLDHRVRKLDSALVGRNPATEIIATGQGDTEPVSSPIALYGSTLKPLSPVHGRMRLGSDGTFILSWVRRARGAWLWSDGIDVPIVEDRERYIVTFGSPGITIATWLLESSTLSLSTAQLADLIFAAPNGVFNIHQHGTHAISEALVIEPLT